MEEPDVPINDRQDASVLRLTATAYHEAGHAVMAVSLGRLIHKVTIRPGKSAFGNMKLGTCELQTGRTKASKNVLEDDVLVLLAGMVAEAQFTGTYCRAGAAQDLLQIKRLLQARTTSDSQLERLERRFLDKTEHELASPGLALAVRHVASELLEKTTISGRAVRHLFEQAMRQAS